MQVSTGYFAKYDFGHALFDWHFSNIFFMVDLDKVRTVKTVLNKNGINTTLIWYGEHVSRHIQQTWKKYQPSFAVLFQATWQVMSNIHSPFSSILVSINTWKHLAHKLLNAALCLPAGP